MGCLCTKAKPTQYSSNGTHHVQVVRPTNNGIERFNSHNLYSHNRNDVTPGTTRINGGPAKKTKVPESRVLTPSPLETGPPTPEEDRPSLRVQYAEDLLPVTPLPDVITVATFMPKRNKVHVSTVSLNSEDSTRHKGSRSLKLSNDDVTIEDLDTELDQYSKYSKDRYPFKPGERINPDVTDVLLPRRKTKQTDKDGEKQATTDQVKTKSGRSKRKKNSDEKGEGRRAVSKDRRPKSKDGSRHRKEVRAKTPDGVEKDLEITDINEQSIVIGEKSDLNAAVTNSISNDIDKAEQIEENATKSKAIITGNDGEGEKRLSSAKSLESSSVFVPKDIYQKELEKERMKRKRKHRTQRKQAVSETVKTFDDGKTEEELKRGLKAKPIFESRPGSGTSVWTLESTNSLLSQGSKSSVHSSASHDNISLFKSRENSQVSKFSYVPSGTTPLSFRQDGYDQDAQLLDLESEYGADDVTGDGVIVSARVMDPFYGIKPYKTGDDVLEKAPVDDIPTGSSTSYSNMKQKLLYSRFARRPHSETNLKTDGKPPLPPGTTLKMRPASDTDRRNTTFSRYFTSDLDIH